MSRVSYRLDTAAFREHILNSPWMVREMRSRAERAKDLFEAIAPVGSPLEGDDHAGTFRDSAVVTAGTDGGVKKDRAWGRMASTDLLALPKEYGHHAPDGSFVEGSHAIVRSMDAMGGQFGHAAAPKFGGRGKASQKKRAQAAARRARRKKL